MRIEGDRANFRKDPVVQAFSYCQLPFLQLDRFVGRRLLNTRIRRISCRRRGGLYYRTLECALRFSGR